MFGVDLFQGGYSLICPDEDSSTEHLPCDTAQHSTLKEVMKRKYRLLCCFASGSYI